MSSFVLVRIPAMELSSEEFREKVNETSALKSEDRRGSLPDSLVEVKRSFSFDYGYEYTKEVEKLEGKEEIKAADKVRLVVTKNFLAIEKRNKDILEEIMTFFEKNFVKGRYQLETLEFDEKLLRAVIDKMPEVTKTSISPKKKGSRVIDELSATGRGNIVGSNFWETYGEEPLIAVKFSLEGFMETPQIGFKKKGIITIYNRNLTRDQLTALVNYVAENIISIYVKSRGFQQRLGV